MICGLFNRCLADQNSAMQWLKINSAYLQCNIFEMVLSIASSLPQFVCDRHYYLLSEGWIVGGGDTCAGLASEGETGESPPREPGCMWRVWPSVAVSTRAANGLREFHSARRSLLLRPSPF